MAEMKYLVIGLMTLLCGLFTVHPLRAAEWWEGTFVTQRFVSSGTSLVNACTHYEDELTIYRRNRNYVFTMHHGCRLSRVTNVKSLDAVILDLVDCEEEGVRSPSFDGRRLLMRYSKNRVLEYGGVEGEAFFHVLLRCPQ